MQSCSKLLYSKSSNPKMSSSPMKFFPPPTSVRPLIFIASHAKSSSYSAFESASRASADFTVVSFMTTGPSLVSIVVVTSSRDKATVSMLHNLQVRSTSGCVLASI
eukprot:gene23436-biopygen1595